MPGGILVPIGGSAESIVALPTALSLARSLDADVHLVSVLQIPAGPLSGTARALGSGPAAAAVRARIDRALATAAQDLKTVGLRGSSTVVEGGDVAGALLDQARERNATMIAMAARPRPAMERALYGSVADRLVREPEVPVVVIPVRDRPDQRAFVQATEVGSGLVGAALDAARPVRRVLVPIDESPHALRVFKTLGPVARAADDVMLLHAVRPAATAGAADAPLTNGGRPLDRHIREACDRLDGIAEQLRTVIPALRRVIMRADDPADAIITAARDRGVDLIAMSTRGDGGLKRAVLGSTASAVLRSTVTPILLVARR